MGQHCAKGRYLDPENFSKELVLNFNLGPLKDLDGLIDEVLALDYAKSYLRMQFEIGRTATGDLNKSANKSFGPTEKVCSDGPAINSSYVNALSSFAAGSSYFVHESM